MGAEQQAANVTPPRRGAVLAIGVSTSAEAYDITGIALGGYTPNGANILQSYVYLTLHAEDGEVFYYFSSTNDEDITATDKITAGAAIAFDNKYAARLAENQEVSVRINRAVDKYLVLRTNTGTPICRVWASSEGF
jgi:hypothetical protein